MSAIIMSQEINRYYNEFLNTELIFSKDVIRTLKIDPRQIYIKAGGSQWSCIINSSSFTNAKVILSVTSEAYKLFSSKPQTSVNLRFSFFRQDGQTTSFFISGKVEHIMPYMNSNELVVAEVQYSQRPPDDFIEMIGAVLDANANSIKRNGEYIPISQETLRKLQLSKKEIVVTIDNVPRRCVLQELSFNGAKIVMMGLSKFLDKKEISLQLDFEDPLESMVLKGVVGATNLIEGRKDLLVANILFAEGGALLAYKIRINKYMTMVKKVNSIYEENKDTGPASEDSDFSL